TAGYHVRNYIGGMFNNYLDGVGISDSIRAFRLQRAQATGKVSKLPARDQALLQDAVEAGLFADEMRTGFEIPTDLATRRAQAAGDYLHRPPKKPRLNERLAARIEGDAVEIPRLRRRAASTARIFGVTDNALTRL